MAEMIFYQQLALLDKNKHKDLRLSKKRDFEFANKANSVPVTAVEFFDASRDYPIVFSPDEEQRYWPVAILSLLEDDPPKTPWDQVYVPAFIRRYPFATEASGRIALDEGAPQFSDEDGEPMFDEQGEPTEELKTISKFLLGFDQQVRKTETFCQACAQQSLFQPLDAEVSVKDHRIRLQNLYVMDEDKLNNVADDTVIDWMRRGWIGLIYAHLHSLGAIERLRQRHLQF